MHTFFVILRDGKLGVVGATWWKSVTSQEKKFKELLCIIKEIRAYMEWVIQRSMFYSFHLFISILLRNVDSALVSDSNAYIWVSNCIQMFEFVLHMVLKELEWHVFDDVEMGQKKQF